MAQDLSDRAAAEIVTRQLPNDRRSVIDRIRKGFAKDREYYLRAGKVNEIIRLITAGKRATTSTDENRETGDKDEPLVEVVLPDDDTLEAMFQELRSKLRAVCMLTDKDPVVVFPKLVAAACCMVHPMRSGRWLVGIQLARGLES